MVLQARASTIQSGRDASHRARLPRVSACAAPDVVPQASGVAPPSGAAEGEEMSDSEDQPFSRASFVSPPASNHPHRQQLSNSSTHSHAVRELLLQINSPQMNQSDLQQATAIVINNAAVPVSPMAPLPVVAASKTKTERLRELREMLSNEIITQEEYASAREVIIRS